MRALVFPLCLIVGACSIEPYYRSAAPQTTDRVVSQTVRRVFAETTLPGTPEISQVRAAHPVSPGDWLVCLRSSDPKQRLRYAIYFTGYAYVRSQLASLVDRCDEESYLPVLAERAIEERAVKMPFTLQASGHEK